LKDARTIKEKIFLKLRHKKLNPNYENKTKDDPSMMTDGESFASAMTDACQQIFWTVRHLTVE
jgi:hypothetical protein